MKFRKKPVVIEAVQWFKYGDHPAVVNMGVPLIMTLEGPLYVTPGDWIIKGVAGEFYPCKPDIFAATYEPVSDDAPAAPQAEPKREALHGLAPTHRCPACGAFWRQCDDASWNLRSASCCGLCDAGRVELVCWLDEPKREALTGERITKGEYVLATKWGDGDPGDHWGVGFYDRFENGRHYVVDGSGQQIRGGGFRRAGRITMEVGIWLLSAAKSLEASPPGTVNLWTMLTERAHGIGGSDEC